jgi:hypothetical protein
MTASEDPFSGAVPLRKPPLEIGLFLEAIVLRELSLKMDFQRRSSLQNRLSKTVPEENCSYTLQELRPSTTN